MPEKLITYTQKFTVYRTDGDHLGHVKLGALLRYAQQVATAHAEAVGLDPCHPARALQARRQQAHHPFLRCRRGRGRHNGQPLGTH